MSILPVLLATLLAGFLVLVVPGAAMMMLLRLDRAVPAPLRPAFALALSLLLLTAVLAVTLALELPLWWTLGGMLGIALLGWLQTASRWSQEGGGSFGHELRLLVRLLAWGEWRREVPGLTWLLALLVGALAFATGLYAWNDSLYHIAQARKLVDLDAPSFATTLQFPDGTAHPGYLVPTWQAAMALVSRVTGIDVLVVAWVLPTLTVPIAALTAGGLGQVLLRSRAASAPSAAAWIAINVVAMSPFPDSVHNSMHPGVIALDVLVPLALGITIATLWPDPLANAPARGRWGTALAVPIAGIAILHLSYLVVLALPVMGYLAFWTLRGPWRRQLVGRHLRVLGLMALVAIVVGVPFLRELSQLEGFGRDAATELEANESDLYFGRNGVELDALLRGTKDAFHLRADHLVKQGGLALLALLATLPLLLWRRWPGGWLLAGSALVVLGIALTDVVFPRYVHAVSLDQARRIAAGIPFPQALGAAATLLASRWVAASTCGGMRRRQLAIGIGAFLVAAAWIVVDRVPPLIGYAGEQVVEPRVIVVVLALLAIATFVAFLLWLKRCIDWSGKRQDARDRAVALHDDVSWPTIARPRITAAVATLAIVVMTLPALDGGEGDDRGVDAVFASSRIDELPRRQRAGELRLFSPNVGAALNRMPVGTTVLADPRSRDPYAALALGPVYVVSSVPRHTAMTVGNRVEERYRTAISFFGAPPEAAGSDSPLASSTLSDRERLQLLLDESVEYVIAAPKSYAAGKFLKLEPPGITLVERGKNQFLYRVDAAKLRAGLAARR